MGNPKFTCDQCGGEIVEYYSEGYKGKRGRCLHCGVDFPLE